MVENLKPNKRKILYSFIMSIIFLVVLMCATSPFIYFSAQKSTSFWAEFFNKTEFFSTMFNPGGELLFIFVSGVIGLYYLKSYPLVGLFLLFLYLIIVYIVVSFTSHKTNKN